MHHAGETQSNTFEPFDSFLIAKVQEINYAMPAHERGAARAEPIFEKCYFPSKRFLRG